MKVRTYVLILIAIAVFGLIIRVVDLSRVPSGISSDVLLYFSNARSIAETGKDIYNHAFPLYFAHKGYLISPVTVYVTAFVYKVFGFSQVNGYIPNIVMSVMTIVITALLATFVTGKRRVGVFAALIVSVSPWHYHLSRTGFEGVFAFSLVLAGIYASILAIKRPIYFILSLFLFIISTFSYKAVNIFLFLYPLLFVFTIGWKRVKTLHAVLFTAGIWVVIALQSFLLFSYYHDTYAGGIVSNNISRAAADTDTERLQSDAPRAVRVLFSNVPLSLTRIFITNYVNFFSPQYLLTQGDADPRFSTGGRGQLYLLDVVLIIGGIIWLVKSKQKISLIFLLAIIFVAPITSLVSDEEYAIRTYIALFAFAILGACGMELLLTSRIQQSKRKIIIGILAFLYAASFVLYLYRYHFLYTQFNVYYNRPIWDYGERAIFKEAYARSFGYKRITFGRSSEFEYLGFMYWNSLPVTSIQKAMSTYDDKTLSYKNVYFVRNCSYVGDTLTPGSLDNELLYTQGSCFKDIPPVQRYYIPKTLVWLWESYDATSLKVPSGKQ